jgi:hypothetical protein
MSNVKRPPSHVESAPGQRPTIQVSLVVGSVGLACTLMNLLVLAALGMALMCVGSLMAHVARMPVDIAHREDFEESSAPPFFDSHASWSFPVSARTSNRARTPERRDVALRVTQAAQKGLCVLSHRWDRIHARLDPGHGDRRQQRAERAGG